MSIQQIKAYARKYYKFGWNILPLFEYSKNPATGNKFLPSYWQNPITKKNFLEKQKGFNKKQGWWPLSQRKQTVDEIKKWINNENLTGIGVVTGAISNITVVDEDSYKEGGKRFHLATPLIALSANGGFHHYFRFNKNVSTTGLKQGVFIEIKSAGGFIVLPPSKIYKKDHTISQYTWYKQNLKNIEDLPSIDESALVDVSIPQKQIKHTILSDLEKTEFGEQHNNLRTMINSLLYKHDPRDWKEFAYPIIREKAAQFQPSHPEWRVEKLIKDCSMFILRKKNEKKAPQSIQKIVQKRIAEKQLEKKAPSTGYADLDRILKGFIPKHLYCVSGLTNTGKTSLCSNFAVKVAEQNKKVLYFALEPDNNIVDYLASAQTSKNFADLTTDDLSSINSNIEIYTKDQINSLSEMIDSLTKLPRYDLVIIDHLAYFIKGESNVGVFQEQENSLKKLVSIAQQLNTAILFIVHLRKKTGYKKKNTGEQHIPSMDELKGSSALSQDSTDVLFITRAIGMDGVTQENDGRIIVTKTKSGKNGAMEIYFVDNSAKILGPEEISTRMF